MDYIDRSAKIFLEELPTLVADIIIIIAGIYILFDDAQDFSKFNHEPKREFFDFVHHWQFGIILIMLGFLLLAIEIVKILMRLGIINIDEDIISLMRKRVGENKWLGEYMKRLLNL